MYIINKMKRWSRSSISDDKQELEAYQTFKNEFANIKKYQDTYLKEEGREDNRLFIPLSGELVPLHFLLTLKESVLNNKKLDAIDRAKKASQIEELHRLKLQELENKIIHMAITTPDNVYLKQISSSLSIINTLIKRYAHLMAITSSGVKTVSNRNELRALEDSILIRISEIEHRIAMDTKKR